MKSAVVSICSTVTAISTVTAAVLIGLATPGLSQPFYRDGYDSYGNRYDYGYRNGWVANRRLAEDICVDAVERQGLRVIDILGQNEYEGGAEIIMQVQERRGSLTVGCDYADNSRRVQLYQVDARRYDDDYNDNNDYNDSNDSWGGDWRRDDDRYSYDDYVNSDSEAVRIARRAVEEQLGVDANSDVIEINDLREGNRRWRVDGQVNGAPFRVLIRSEDGSVEDFRLR